MADKSASIADKVPPVGTDGVPLIARVRPAIAVVNAVVCKAIAAAASSVTVAVPGPVMVTKLGIIYLLYTLFKL